ncbi:2-keto-3-deoxygluconate permease [uncultured Anaerococcus sp.]|uniref:2-keto-3-deoxygluconate permease n=1 Tax=uncultured Anaerococcus sp. TaxID=293428 RepID=UPI0028893586|nr:2-keto-3-deoxygluconate permease [uncultured Anaerococcus sp.]
MNNFIKKIPASSIIIPMLISSSLNTLAPGAMRIGPMSAAFSSEIGLNSIIYITLVAVGSQLTIKRFSKAIKRGSVLLISKVITSIIVSFIYVKVFGKNGIFGISSLAFISSISNQNNSIFIGMTNDYGDEYDIASAAIMAIISVPIFTFIILSFLGVAKITPNSIIDFIIPLLAGVVLGNVDKNFCEFLAGTQKYIMPFLGFAIGAGIDLMAILIGGLAGLVLSFLTVGAAFVISLPADIFINKRPGWAAISTYTAAGNSVIVPSLVANLDPSWQAYESLSSAQLGTVVIMTSLLVPLAASLWMKFYKSK